MGPQAIGAIADVVQIVMDGVVTIALMGVWCYYEIHRTWDTVEKDKHMGVIKLLLVRYRVAVVVAAVLIPEWAKWVPHLFGG